jgi:leukotriene-A4 hydrolase
MAYEEFASSTERFVATAEKIVGVDYDWGSYDVLVLPPSFPYGGMENVGSQSYHVSKSHSNC